MRNIQNIHIYQDNMPVGLTSVAVVVVVVVVRTVVVVVERTVEAAGLELPH
jgi:hypothetical protein